MELLVGAEILGALDVSPEGERRGTQRQGRYPDDLAADADGMYRQPHERPPHEVDLRGTDEPAARDIQGRVVYRPNTVREDLRQPIKRQFGHGRAARSVVAGHRTGNEGALQA